MAWYRAGTIAVTGGSVNVVGTGTQWVSKVSVGEALLGPDGKLYEIASRSSDTTLSLATPYGGATATGQAYVVLPTQSVMRDLAAQVSELVSLYADYPNLVSEINLLKSRVTALESK